MLASISALLLDEIQSGLRDGVKSGDRFGVGLITAFSHDELRKLRGDINVGLFDGASREGTTAACPGTADVGLTGRKAGEKLILTVADQTLLIGEGRQGDLAKRGSLTIAESALNRPVGLNEVTHKSSTGEAVLLRRGGGRGSGNLGHEAGAAGTEKVPGERERVRTVGKTGEGDAADICGGGDELAGAVKRKCATLDHDRSAGGAHVGGRNGDRVIPGVGGGLGEVVREHVRSAKGVEDRHGSAEVAAACGSTGNGEGFRLRAGGGIGQSVGGDGERAAVLCGYDQGVAGDAGGEVRIGGDCGGDAVERVASDGGVRKCIRAVGAGEHATGGKHGSSSNARPGLLAGRSGGQTAVGIEVER
jgi:hypothetical protein